MSSFSHGPRGPAYPHRARDRERFVDAGARRGTNRCFLDEIGQLFGDNPGIGNNWRHKEFFLALVRYLRSQGF